MRDQGLARSRSGMLGGWSEAVSELAVWGESSGVVGFPPGSAERQDWVQFAVSATGERNAGANLTSTADNRVLYLAIAVLAVAGVAVSAVSLERHYAKSATAFCDIGERFNCDIVNRSEQSTVMGIPVAGIGIVGYGVLLALATVYRSRIETPTWLLSAAVAGLAFASYLTYIEGYVLDTWCILCLSSLGLIAGIAGLAGVVRARASA
jgi:vitamin-K-epoxide reductase (warfarin-sensitive)